MIRICLSPILRLWGRFLGLAAMVAVLPVSVSGQVASISNVGANQVTLGLTAQASGTGYFTLLAGTANCGSATQTVNGQNSSGAAAYRRGSLPLSAGTAGSYTVRNLTQDTAYTVCFTPDGNTAPVSTSFSTKMSALGAGADWTLVGSAGFSPAGVVSMSVAFAPDGTPWVTFEDNYGIGRAMYYTGGTWILAGNSLSTGIVWSPSLAFAPDGTPYVLYIDQPNGERLSAVLYRNGAWIPVGSPDFSQGKAYLPSLAFAPDGTPFAAYTDGGSVGYDNSLRVMSYTGGSWKQVGTDFVGGGGQPSLAFAPDGTPCVAYVTAVQPSMLAAMQYIGGAWTPLGSTNIPNDNFSKPSLSFAPSGTPYIAYTADGYNPTVSVIRYNGIWSQVGPVGFAAGSVFNSSLTFGPDGTPFVMFQRNAGGQRANVMRYLNSAWSTVGRADFSAGEAFSLASAFAPDGSPYVVYEDATTSLYRATAMKIQATLPSLTLSPSSIAFPSTAIGSVSNVQTATLSNSSTSAVYLNTPSLTDSADFTQSDNCGGIVVAGSSCTISFTFMPQSTGALNSTYSIADLNNQSSPLTVALSGNGTGSYGLTITPSSIAFPSTAVGGASSTMTATLKLNGGSTRVNLTTGSLTDSADFTQSDNCGGGITPNGTCTVTFTFTPKSATALGSTYSIGLQGGSSPVTVALSGTGTSAIPSLTPSSLNFGNVKVGSTSSGMTATLSNSGNAALPIQGITFATSNGGYAETDNCGTSLAAGSSCMISVTCAPTASGTQTSTLNVNFPSLLPTQSVSLSCTGVNPAPADFALSATPSAQSSYRGQSVSYAIHLNSVDMTNPFTAAVALTVTGLPANATASFSPASVTPGATGVDSKLTVTIAPLSGANHERNSPLPMSPVTTALASLGVAGLLLQRRRRTGRSLPRLLLWLLVSAVASSVLVGCGDGHGFGIPTPTSTLTITGTSAMTTHTTTVTLTVQ